MNIYELSTYPFIKDARSYRQSSLEDKVAAALFLEYHIINYGLLEEAINKGIPEFQNNYFFQMLKKAYDTLNKENNKKLTAPVYSFDTYSLSGLPIDVLSHTDYVTSCTVLPFNSPLADNRGLAYRLSEFNIQMAKEMLASYATSSKNALEMCVFNFGHNKSEQLFSLIKFYEDQIIRTASETPDLKTFTGSLFTKDAKEKRSIVAGNALDMCDYLLSEGDEFIWGKMTNEKKDTLKARIYHPNDSKDLKTHFKFIDTISSYTTLQELETPLSRKRALDRFIIK